MWAKEMRGWAILALLLAVLFVGFGMHSYQLNQEIEHQQELSSVLIQGKQEVEQEKRAVEKQLITQRKATAFYYEQLAGCAASVEQLIEMVQKKRSLPPADA